MTDVELDAAAIAATAVGALQAGGAADPEARPRRPHRVRAATPTWTWRCCFDSAEALLDTFVDLALVRLRGTARRQESPRPGRRARARRGGDDAAATGGVNTHRGALWTVGLLVTAAGVHSNRGRNRQDRRRGLAAIPDSAAAPPPSSHGQRAVQRYRVSGAVGEAVAGFPHITRVALPTLRAARAAGDTEERARLRALLALIATVDDTCVLHRGGRGGLRWMQRDRAPDQPRAGFDGALERFVVAGRRGPALPRRQRRPPRRHDLPRRPRPLPPAGTRTSGARSMQTFEFAFPGDRPATRARAHRRRRLRRSGGARHAGSDASRPSSASAPASTASTTSGATCSSGSSRDTG